MHVSTLCSIYFLTFSTKHLSMFRVSRPLFRLSRPIFHFFGPIRVCFSFVLNLFFDFYNLCLDFFDQIWVCYDFVLDLCIDFLDQIQLCLDFVLEKFFNFFDQQLICFVFCDFLNGQFFRNRKFFVRLYIDTLRLSRSKIDIIWFLRLLDQYFKNFVYSTVLDLGFDCARPMVQLCSTNISIVIDLFFDFLNRNWVFLDFSDLCFDFCNLRFFLLYQICVCFDFVLDLYYNLLD